MALSVLKASQNSFLLCQELSGYTVELGVDVVWVMPCRSLHQNSDSAHCTWKEPVRPQWLVDQHPVPAIPLSAPSAGGERVPSLEKIKARENAYPQPSPVLLA